MYINEVKRLFGGKKSKKNKGGSAGKLTVFVIQNEKRKIFL